MSIEDVTLETKADIGTDKRALVRRWLMEIQLASKREDTWRKSAGKALDRYRQKEQKAYSFNILWSNTETLRPAIYNSLPKPDVRRRFKDADPLGKAVSECVSRALEFSCDTYDFDGVIKQDVLNMLLPGRAVSRVRYIPTLASVGGNEEDEPQDAEAMEGDGDELQWEQVVVEHVQWDDFRIGAGKTWEEVRWIAFKHRLTREEMEEKFGEVGANIPLDSAEDDELKALRDDDPVADMFKTALVWEIWDKDNLQVLFIAPSYKDAPAKELEDPLGLQGFWPIPRPLYAIEDSSTTVPASLYDMYKEQAAELDRVTLRINTLIKGLKMRGIYDSTLSELSELMRGEDNDMIPAQNVTALLERGGLEKAIWFMPIEQSAKVLKELYVQREQTKQVIYEITGVSDILRGSTDASETATAQQIKSQWGSMRLKRLQADVQRYIRDLLRLKAEIICEKFQPETLIKMTGLNYPTAEQKQQAMAQYQQQAMMAQQQGQPAPPQPNIPPSWDEIFGVMHDDMMRSYKIDIETDSTVAASMESDMQGLQQTMTGIIGLINGLGPAVQQGAIPVEVVKELVLTVCRRSKMGNAVEDALDKIQQPPPQPPQQDNSTEVAKIKAQQADQEHQREMQMEQQRLQMEERARQQEQQTQAAIEQHRNEMEFQRESQQQRHDAALEQVRAHADQQTKIILAHLERMTKIEVAEISAQTTLSSQQIGAAQQGADDANV